MLAALWLSVALHVLMEGDLAEAEGLGGAGPHYRADCAPRGDGRLCLFRARLFETPAELPEDHTENRVAEVVVVGLCVLALSEIGGGWAPLPKYWPKERPSEPAVPRRW